MKAITSMIILLGCGILGFIRAARWEEKMRLLCDLRICFANLKRYIEYEAMPLHAALKKSLFSGCCREIETLFARMEGRMESGGQNIEIFREELDRIRKEKDAFSLLHEQEYNVVANFLDSVGTMDARHQKEHFEMLFEMLDERIAVLRPEIKKKEKMCRALGILGGLTITILLL